MTSGALRRVPRTLGVATSLSPCLPICAAIAAAAVQVRAQLKPQRGEQQEEDPRLQSFGIGNATWVGTPRIISWHPMAAVYDDFLSHEECDYLLNISRPLMEPAMLVNSNVQKHRRSKSRTSHGAFHDSFGDPVLAMITHRIGHVARVPPGALLTADAAHCAQLRRCHQSCRRSWARAMCNTTTSQAATRAATHVCAACQRSNSSSLSTRHSSVRTHTHSLPHCSDM